MSEKKPLVSEKTGVVLGALGLFIIFTIVMCFAWFGKCDSDGSYLACKVKGTVGDWLGSLIFLASLAFVVYFGGIKKNLYNPIGSQFWNWIWLAAAAIGMGVMLLF